MEVQIFGTLKCQETNKAVRFFKERKIKVHFVDLREKAITKGELDNISRSVPLQDLLDTEGKEFTKSNLKYMAYDTESALLDNPLLFKTPITRFSKKATIGYQPEVWKEWIKMEAKPV
jgi:arsenate reductase-like glutaredoxin family protein